MDTLVQLLGLLLLVGGVFLGYGRWVRPRADSGATAALLLLLVLTLMGGFIGAFGWWLDDPRTFSWDLPPLASRMLAAAGWAFAAATLITLQNPRPGRVRLFLLMLAVYLAPLTLAIVFSHLDRFDWSAPITFAFFAIVLLMTLPALFFLLRTPAIRGMADDDTPSNAQVRVFLLSTAAVMALWGGALFLTDSGGSDLIWVWPGDLLTSRLIAVMLLTIAAGAAYSARHADRARVMLVTMVVYGLGVAAANLYQLVADRPVKWSYVLVFLGLALLAALLRWRMGGSRQ